MEPTSIAPEKKPNKVVMVAVGVAAFILLITIVLSFIVSAVAQPTKTDFTHLENKRNVIDVSTDVFSLMFTDFGAAYQTAYSESQSSEERQELKESFLDKYEDEKKIGNERIDSMSGSVALKNQWVSKDFAAFETAYEGVLSYTDEYVHTSTAIIEAVSGDCSKVTKLEPSDEKYAENFVKASNRCLAELAAAKSGASASGKTMLTSLEKLFKDRRDLFKKVVDESDEFKRKAASITALVSILGINSELKAIQTTYEAAAGKEYDSVANKFNDASKTLSKTLDELSSSSAKEGER